MASNRVKPLVLKSIASSALNPVVFQAINSDGFEKPPFFIRMVNSGTTPVSVSFDGTNPHEFIPVGGIFELNSQQNAQPNNWVCKWPAGTKVYVAGNAGVSGTVTISGYYQEAS